MICKDLIHSVGYGTFVILPSDVRETGEISFGIEWKEIRVNGKRFISRTAWFLNVRVKTQELLHTIYVAGNLRIYQIVDNKNQVILSLYGSFDIKDNSNYFFTSRDC